MKSIDQLLSIASKAISEKPNNSFGLCSLGPSPLLTELEVLLKIRNGFYAFESALHVFPLPDGKTDKEFIDLLEWNSVELWRFGFNDLLEGLVFFAEDVFGVQFAIRNDEIISFDPDTGEVTLVANSLEGWADSIVKNYPILTGYPIAHDWQISKGPLQERKRLLPKIPFVLGGKFEIENLIAVDAVEAMRYRADLWRQIRDLPDGAQVRLNALPVH